MPKADPDILRVQLSEELLSFYTHELRTPLTSMRGYIQLLQMKIKEEKEHRWVDELYTQSLRLTNLINDLAEINRVCAVVPTYTFSNQSINALIGEVIKRFNLSYKHQTIEVKNSIGKDNIQADTQKLIYVFGTIVEFLGNHNAKNITFVCTQDTMNHIHLKGSYKGVNSQELGKGLNTDVINHIVKKHRGTVKMETRGDTIYWKFEFPIPTKI